jgi:hypothetical protein
MTRIDHRENNRPSEAVSSRICPGNLRREKIDLNELSETKTDVMPGWIP